MTKQEQRKTEFLHIMRELYQILLERKNASSASSYVASLYEQGLNKILQKIGEESYELILASIAVENMFKQGRNHSNEERKKFAAFNEDEQAIINAAINEVADFWFHILVFLAFLGFDVSAGDLRFTYETLGFAKPEKQMSQDEVAYFHSDKAYRYINNGVFKLIQKATKFDFLQQLNEHKDFYGLKTQAIYLLDVSFAKLVLIPDLSFYDVAKVLQQRMGISGLAEKASRPKI